MTHLEARGRRVLITGVCGFLGSEVCRLLAKSGYSVYGLDRPGLSPPPELTSGHNEFSKFIQADITTSQLGDCFPSHLDYAIHLAGLVSVRESFEEPALYEETNVIGTIRIMQACNRASVKRLVFASSAAVYGDSCRDNKSSDTLLPLSPYGVSKLAAEHYLRVLGPRYGLETVALRFFNLYGPNIRPGTAGALGNFVEAAANGEKLIVLGDGSRTRHFLHVRDAARALLLALTKPDVNGMTIDICGSGPHSIDDLAQIVLECFGRNDLTIIRRPTQMRIAHSSPCSNDIAQRVLGFKAKVELVEGIRETIKALQRRYRNNTG